MLFKFTGRLSSFLGVRPLSFFDQYFAQRMAQTYVIEPRERHTASVIFLHGLGDTGASWCESFREIASPHVRYIFPTAPIRKVTLNFGMPMPAWFDIFGLAPDSKEDIEGTMESCKKLLDLVRAEQERGVATQRIAIGGFSQGGAVAMYTAFAGDLPTPPLGGVIALSTWLPMHKKFPAAFQHNRQIAVLQCHGEQDPLVPLQWGQHSSHMVRQFAQRLQFKTYPDVMHSSCGQEMRDIKAFVATLFPQL